MRKVKLYLNYAGYCWAKESDAIKGGRHEKIKFHALWGLIQHPEKGWILYDTGYTKRFYEATKRFPNKIYALLTKVVVQAEDEIKSQLERNGISAQDIRHIIITHFHADHIGGLRDFPNAQVYASKAAIHQLTHLPQIPVSKGILTALLPADLHERITMVEEISEPVTEEMLGTKYDLFGDQSIYIVSLPGHAAGQIGVLLETTVRPYFLIADACWLSKSFEQNILPNPIVRLFFDSWADFKNSLEKVHQYSIVNFRTCIVPTHCYKTTSKLVSDKINMNEL